MADNLGGCLDCRDVGLPGGGGELGDNGKEGGDDEEKEGESGDEVREGFAGGDNPDEKENEGGEKVVRRLAVVVDKSEPGKLSEAGEEVDEGRAMIFKV